VSLLNRIECSTILLFTLLSSHTFRNIHISLNLTPIPSHGAKCFAVLLVLFFVEFDYFSSVLCIIRHRPGAGSDVILVVITMVVCDCGRFL